jgi:ribosomal protein S18 acetylase RimI-like enzyme
LTKQDIRLVATDDPATREKIHHELRDFISAKIGPGKTEKMTLAARNSNGEIVGGLNYNIVRKWMYIDHLWIDEKYRSQGIASSLLKMAEARAKEYGCTGIHCSTYSFLAEPLYLKHGFKIFGQIEDFPEGSRHLFLSKRLE